MKAGYYDDAFIKLFGKVEPPFGSKRPDKAWAASGRRAPLIDASSGSDWPSPAEYKTGKQAIFAEHKDIPRRVLIPGAYLVDQLRDERWHKNTLVNLARFHSNHAANFENNIYKNDGLGIDYYRVILTLMNKPEDIEARIGIGDIYYEQRNYGKAARYYNKALESHPMDVRGHAGLLNTYIENWKVTGDPRLVLAKHREIYGLGLEEDLPIYLTAKLAGFYIDIDPDNLRIQYQIDPVDQVSGLNLRSYAAHLLEIVFKKEEERDGEIIIGSQYGEGYYQRGRFLQGQKESLRAVRQFQNAHNYDPLHYLAINAIGEYYKGRRDFDKASEYFLKAARTEQQFMPLRGNRPEDETLLSGDSGRIFYNLGSISFLRNAGFENANTLGFPDTRIYPNRTNQPETARIRKRRENLARARDYLKEARQRGLIDKNREAHMNYWMGWIDYTNADFESALVVWEEIDPLYSDADPVLLLGRGNSYFYTDQLRAALGNYLKVQADYEQRVAEIKNPDPSNHEHRYYLMALAATNNNIGAVYEKEFMELSVRGGSIQELKELEENALLHYYRAIDLARQAGQDNEVARTNLQLAFKYGRQGTTISQRNPLIDDWISPVLESMRTNL